MTMQTGPKRIEDDVLLAWLMVGLEEQPDFKQMQRLRKNLGLMRDSYKYEIALLLLHPDWLETIPLKTKRRFYEEKLRIIEKFQHEMASCESQSQCDGNEILKIKAENMAKMNIKLKPIELNAKQMLQSLPSEK